MKDLVFRILGIDEGSDKFDDVGKASDRAGDKLDGFGKISAKVLGGLPVAAAGAGLAVAGSIGLIAAGFALGGALLVSGNKEVAASVADLTHTISAGAQEAAAPLAGALTDGMRKLKGTAQDLQPEMREAFRASRPALVELTDGVDGLARTAMPGMVTAVKSSQPVMVGWKNLLIDTGLGVSDFFGKMSGGAASAGRITADFGGIVRNVLGFVGGLLASLSNEGAPSVDRLRQVLAQLFATVQGLSSGGFPVLFSTAGMVLNVLSGVLGVIEPIATQFGTVLGIVISVAGAFRMLNAVTGTMQTVGVAVTEFATKVRGAGDEVEGTKSRFGMLSAFVGGPLGLALGVGSLALGLFGQKQAEASRRAEDLAAALRTSKGAIDDNVRSVAASNLQAAGAIDKARQLGISLPQLTDAYLGQGEAAKTLVPGLHALMQAMSDQGVPLQQNAADTKKSAEALQAKGAAVADLLALLEDSAPANAKAVEDAKLLAAATAQSADSTKDLTVAQLGARATAAQMGADFQTLAGTAGDVNARMTALQRIMDELSGKSVSYEDAVQGLNESFRGLAEEFGKNVDKAKGWGQELVNEDGTINTLKANGADLRNVLKGIEHDTLAGADAMATNGASQQEVAGFIQNSRDRFIEQAGAMGITEGQAKALADQYGLIPEQVSTVILTPNLAAKVQEIGALDWQVQHLPNGTIIIDAHTRPAQDGIDRLIQTNDGRVIHIQVAANGDVQALNAAGVRTGLPARASGGPVVAGQTYVTGEEGIELFTPEVNGYIHDNPATERMLSRTTGSDGGGSGGDRYYQLTVVAAANTEIDLREQFRLMEMLDMPVGV